MRGPNKAVLMARICVSDALIMREDSTRMMYIGHGSRMTWTFYGILVQQSLDAKPGQSVEQLGYFCKQHQQRSHLPLHQY